MLRQSRPIDGGWLPAALAIAAVAMACRSPDVGPPPVADLTAADPEVSELVEKTLEEARNAPGEGARRATLGMVYEANGLVRAALESYEQAIRLDPDEPRWWYHAAIVRSRVGDREGALEAMARSGQLATDYAPSHWHRGEWFLDLGREDEAEAAFRQATSLDVQDPAGWAGLARVELRRGRGAEAAKILDRLVRERPGDPYLHHLLGTAYRQLGEPEKARTELNLGKSPERRWRDPWREEVGRHRVGFSASIERAKGMIAAAHYDEAIALLTSLRQQRPGNLPVLNNLSVAYLRSRKLDEAMAVLEEAHDLQPDYFPTHLNLCGAYERRGELERALHHADRAIQINPTLGNAHERRGVILLRMRRLEKSLDALQTALRYEPGNPNTLTLAGVVAGQLGQWELAIPHLDQACRLDPRNLQAHLALVYAKIEVGALDDAEVVLARVRELGPDPRKVRELEEKLQRARDAG